MAQTQSVRARSRKTPNSLRPKIRHLSHARTLKTIRARLFNHKGIDQKEFNQQKQTVSQQYYLKVLKGLPDTVRRKRPDKWIILHDNTPSDSALCVRDFLAKKSDYSIRSSCLVS